MKKVIFCFYPLYVHYNHGIALLSALCKQQGIDTELYMLDSPEKFRIYLSERERYVVCFSAVVARDYKMSLPFMHIAQDEGYVVMFGGVYAKRQGVDLSDCPADFICRGEGETLPDFLLGRSRELFDRPMVCEDINALPMPDYELFKDIPFDRRLSFIDDMKVLPYYSSRGCPYQCSFCEIRLQRHLGANRPRIRYKVGEELAHLADEYQPEVFFIGDETLPYYDSKWRASWGDFRHPFACYLRADVSTEALEWLADRGLKGCGVGIESGDEHYRNAVLKKNLTDEQIFRFVDDANRLGIKIVPFYMNNMPGETITQMATTMQMAKKIGGEPLFFKYEDLTA